MSLITNPSGQVLGTWHLKFKNNLNKWWGKTCLLNFKIIKTNKETTHPHCHISPAIWIWLAFLLFIFPTYASLSPTHSSHFSVSTYASRSPSPSSHFSVYTTLRLPQFFKHRVKQQIISLSQFQPSLALPLSLALSLFLLWRIDPANR